MLSRALSKLFASWAATSATGNQASDGQANEVQEARHEFTI
jgi:hypothetical protein